MVALNRQSLVKDHLIVVTLGGDKTSVTVTIKAPSGKGSYPETIDVAPLLAGGLSETQAIDWVMKIAAASINGTD